MTLPAPVRLLLGPQSPLRNVREAVARLPDGPLAVISAGWQEAEGELDELARYVGRSLEDLRLYERVESLTAQDPSMATAIRERQDRLIDLQRFYRMRLGQLAVAARRMLEAEGDADLLVAEQRHAIAQLRALDRHHLHRSETIWKRFLDDYGPDTHPLLARQAGELETIIGSSAGIIITGGNIAVLVNRMRLLGVARMLRECHVVAWSAGAMVLADRIVLYHDRSPQGHRHPELLGAGSGIVPGYVFLPDAARRLRSRDRLRVGLMSRRFAPDVCVVLDNGSELGIGGAGICSAEQTRRLDRSGRLVKVRAA